MADRLTQLQDSVNLQAENFCNSIGVLQQLAQPSPFPELEKSSKIAPQPQEDYAALFATMIARTAKDMDVLIDSLPSEEAAPELQANNLERLEVENADAALRLKEVVARGEGLLRQVQGALSEIAGQQLSARQPPPLPNREPPRGDHQ
ncbi:mediator of RNA polymerase II transcription subunit 21-like isoform X2 [Varroa jacobsoni]|uniref:Mediator of RNA polymerase II transcription subunit 21 n=1 Tax=Varroa destructor TaxID=109461 RepID=A0A7M7K1W5_VARDE|nr:mediator of RNA polymerase II transcription subunit 21-like isoform X2 [Varroa destructor]XP_022656288.1 mediator of RNA polymerase II transcription subunit 21-like isoform X2 [Varroa destructor]XP_022704159.1 mediator of RNA polymerase II transcription subunit 21-like isoform X2 [Varroa jacobsoni]